MKEKLVGNQIECPNCTCKHFRIVEVYPYTEKTIQCVECNEIVLKL